MSDTVILPPTESRIRRRGGAFIPPLLVVPFILYNFMAFAFFGGNPAVWGQSELFAMPMVSGARWAMSWGDLMLVIALACLFVEVLKSTNSGRSSILEHMLSTGLFVLFLIEFLLVGAAASSVFFVLMLMALFDVVAGFSISITSAGRDVTMA